MREVRIGDSVATYDPSDRAYLIGRIESEVEWHDHPLPRWRQVTWTHRADRDSLTESARSKLGSIATFFKVGAEAEAELQQNAQPLFGDFSAAGSVRGQRPRGLANEDFDVLRRNPASVPWPSLSESDRTAIKSLRQALLSYAVKLADELGAAVTLKPFASHPNPSGRNAQVYWSCVYPQTAPNKSFAFQLFIIVKANVVEIGFGSGSGTAEMSDPVALEERKQQFNSQRERLRALTGVRWVEELRKRVADKGFRLRSK